MLVEEKEGEEEGEEEDDQESNSSPEQSELEIYFLTL